jgi:hypothetical protein
LPKATRRYAKQQIALDATEQDGEVDRTGTRWDATVKSEA